MGKEINSDFHALVEREMKALGFVPLGWSGTQLKYRTADSDKVQELGVGNLRKKVKLNDPGDAPAIVRDFLTNITAISSAEWKLPDTLGECPERVLPRIGKPFAAGVPAPWSDPIPGADDLILNLVVDFPTTMAYVSPDMMAKSGDPAAWVARALANLKAVTPADWLTAMKGDHGVMACHTGDSYDAARALLIGEMTGNDPAGWLVAVPARDWLFARKVDLSGLAHFHRLKIMAEKAKKEQPYPISDTVFWVRPGNRWEVFKIELDGDNVKVYPSEEFMKMIGGLEPEDAP